MRVVVAVAVAKAFPFFRFLLTGSLAQCFSRPIQSVFNTMLPPPACFALRASKQHAFQFQPSGSPTTTRRDVERQWGIALMVER